MGCEGSVVSECLYCVLRLSCGGGKVGVGVDDVCVRFKEGKL